jgi:ABC-type multidrug transport system ATPase subunit
MDTVIRVTGLSKHYREIKAVDGLSFSVYTGEVYGFLGQNGAGKSTTIRMLLSLIKPTAGTIEIFGMNLRSHRKSILKQVGAIIERPDMYPYLSAIETVSVFAKLSGHNVSSSQIMEQLEMVGLKDRANSRVKSFSQGMKQRLGLAVALIHDPGLIVLDEPTNGLDPQGIADVRNLILHLSKHQNKTVVVSSHLLSEMEMIADRMLILDGGKKVREGSKAELFDPSDMHVQFIMLNAREMANILNETKWKTSMQEVHNQEILFRLHKAQIPELTSELVQYGAQIMEVVQKHSLEHYFLSLTTANQHVDTFTD